MDKAAIAELVDPLASVSQACRFCGIVVGNVWKHQKRCKNRIEQAPAPVAAAAVPDVPGGDRFMPRFKAFLAASLAPKVALQWYRKAAAIVAFWEQNVQGFRVDKLLEPMHHRLIMPSLTGYLAQATSTGDGATACKVYSHFVDFVVEIFNQR